MKCPLLWIAKPEVEIGLSSEHDCLKVECAWWSESCKMCSMKALSSDIGFLAGVLQNIETKMPVAKE